MKVLVIGESCLDVFVYGEVKRMSPEAPVPVFSPLYTRQNGGMAANTMANLVALEPDLECVFLTPPNNITKTRYIEDKSNHMFMRVDDGENEKLEKFKWTSFVQEMIYDADFVVVSDYNKGYLSDIDLKNISIQAPISILDSKRKLTNEIIKNFTFVKLNESEFNNNKHLNSKNLIITLGKNGAMYQGKSYLSDNPKETIDVSGAGDTFTSAFILHYVTNKDVGRAIKFANLTASQVVSKRGVAVPG